MPDNRLLKNLFRWQLVALLSLPLSAGAAERIRGPVEAEVIRVVDGDTIAVRAHVWPGHIVEVLVRMAGIDTPELKGKCEAERVLAQEARAALERALASGRALLFDVTFDKYGGRALAQIHSDDGQDLGSRLIAANLARAYAGKARRGWCE
jgi:micrococcal nuclease